MSLLRSYHLPRTRSSVAEKQRFTIRGPQGLPKSAGKFLQPFFRRKYLAGLAQAVLARQLSQEPHLGFPQRGLLEGVGGWGGYGRGLGSYETRTPICLFSRMSQRWVNTRNGPVASLNAQIGGSTGWSFNAHVGKCKNMWELEGKLGCLVHVLFSEDWWCMAREANGFEAQCKLGLAPGPAATCSDLCER